MDARLERLIRVYEARVAEAVALLRDASIPPPTSTMECVGNRIPASGRLGAGYRKHGYGCCVTFPDGEVEFDFG